MKRSSVPHDSNSVGQSETVVTEHPIVVPYGELPHRLTEILSGCVEIAHASTPWLRGDVHVPLAQAHELAAQLSAMVKLCNDAIEECRVVYKTTRRLYAS